MGWDVGSRYRISFVEGWVRWSGGLDVCCILLYFYICCVSYAVPLSLVNFTSFCPISSILYYFSTRLTAKKATKTAQTKASLSANSPIPNLPSTYSTAPYILFKLTSSVANLYKLAIKLALSKISMLFIA